MLIANSVQGYYEGHYGKVWTYERKIGQGFWTWESNRGDEEVAMENNLLCKKYKIIE